MSDLNSKVAADSFGTFHFKGPLFYVLISTVFHTFLKIKTWREHV